MALDEELAITGEYAPDLNTYPMLWTFSHQAESRYPYQVTVLYAHDAAKCQVSLS